MITQCFFMISHWNKTYLIYDFLVLKTLYCYQYICDKHPIWIIFYQKSFLPFEEPFDVIHQININACRDIMQKHMATRFSNVTTDHINIYRSFCEKCGLKKSKARMCVVVKSILTPNVMSRGQVDLIDMQVNKKKSFHGYVSFLFHFIVQINLGIINIY